MKIFLEMIGMLYSKDLAMLSLETQMGHMSGEKLRLKNLIRD
jgi:hypothetical protein